MGKDDRDEVARRELKHALEALGDGSGQEVWGPGPVMERLTPRSWHAAQAFGYAVTAAWSALTARQHYFENPKPSLVIEATRKLAPVMLEIMLEERAREEGRQSIFKSVVIGTSNPTNAMYSCAGCGLLSTSEPSVTPRDDGYPRCNDCHHQRF